MLEKWYVVAKVVPCILNFYCRYFCDFLAYFFKFNFWHYPRIFMGVEGFASWQKLYWPKMSIKWITVTVTKSKSKKSNEWMDTSLGTPVIVYWNLSITDNRENQLSSTCDSAHLRPKWYSYRLLREKCTLTQLDELKKLWCQLTSCQFRQQG